MDDLRKLLGSATTEQRKPLVQLISANVCNDESPEKIIRGIRWLHANIFEDFAHEVFGHGKPLSYAGLLEELLRELGVEVQSNLSEPLLELILVRRIGTLMLQDLAETQRSEVERVFRSIFETNGRAKELAQVGGVVGTLVAANLSGFGCYQLASFALGAASGALGVTVPFSAYSAMSSGISLAIGPFGWLATGIFAAYKLTGTNYSKLIPVALYLSLLRLELARNPNHMYGGLVVSSNYIASRPKRLL